MRGMKSAAGKGRKSPMARRKKRKCGPGKKKSKSKMRY